MRKSVRVFGTYCLQVCLSLAHKSGQGPSRVRAEVRQPDKHARCARWACWFEGGGSEKSQGCALWRRGGDPSREALCPARSTGPRGAKRGGRAAGEPARKSLYRLRVAVRPEKPCLSLWLSEAAQRFAGSMAVTSCLWRIHITPYQHLLYTAHVFLSTKKLFSVS